MSLSVLSQFAMCWLSQSVYGCTVQHFEIPKEVGLCEKVFQCVRQIFVNFLVYTVCPAVIHLCVCVALISLLLRAQVSSKEFAASQQ